MIGAEQSFTCHTCLFVIRLNYNRVKDVWWVKEYKLNRFVYYPVVVVENHQRHSQHMEDWFLYNREFTFDQYLFREKTMNNRSHHSLEKIPNTKKKKFNFSLRIPAVWSFFSWLSFSRCCWWWRFNVVVTCH